MGGKDMRKECNSNRVTDRRGAERCLKGVWVASATVRAVRGRRGRVEGRRG